MIEAAGAPLLLRDDELAVLELAQVVKHRDPRGVELRGHLAYRAPRVRLDDVEDFPAGGASERVEDSGHVIHM